MEAFLFVWFAGIVSKIAGLIGMVGVVTMLGTTCVYGFRYVNWADSCREPDPKKKPPFKFHFKMVITGFVMMVVAAILPSERTLYLAGAAYMGQKMVQSEAAEKVVKILNSKLDEYLEETESKLKK